MLKILACLLHEQLVSCTGNAPTERFFRSLKYEQLNAYSFRTKKEAELCILDYLAYPLCQDSCRLH